MDYVVQVLNIKSITLVGLLLSIIAYLIYDRMSMIKNHTKEREDLRKELLDSQKKLEKEYKESSSEIKVIIEKYYTLSSQFLAKIDIIVNKSLS